MSSSVLNSKEGSVFSPNDEWTEMQQYVALTRALRGSTETMRKEMPPTEWRKEDPARYEARTNSTYLLDAYARAITGPSDRVFSDGVLVDKDAPSWFKEKMNSSVDGRGTKLRSWCPPIFQMGRDRGITHVFTDATAPESGPASSYWKHVTTGSLIGWKTRWTDDGLSLRQIRILEKHTVPVSPFHDEEVERVRVIDADSGWWAVWELDEDGNDAVAIDYETGFEMQGPWDLDYITFRSFRTDFRHDELPFFAKPKQLALAWKNLEHWELSSLVGNNRASNLIPMRTFIGLDEDEWNAINHIGTGMAVWSENEDAKIGIVETTGEPLNQGRKELERIESQMEIMARAPLMAQRQGNITATENLLDSEEATSEIKQEAACFEDFLELISRDMAEFEGAGDGLPDNPIVIPGKDYAVIKNPADIANVLNLLKDVSSLSPVLRETALREAVEYGVLSENTDVEVLLDGIEDMPPAGQAGSTAASLQQAMALVEQGASIQEAVRAVNGRPTQENPDQGLTGQ